MPICQPSNRSRTTATYRHQEQHASDHGRERRTAHLARIYVPKQPDRKRPDGGDNVRAVEDEVVRNLVRRVRDARDDDHDNELDGPERLQIHERGRDREDGHDDELRPPRERLQVPREVGRTVAPKDDVLAHERRPGREGERSRERLAAIDVHEGAVVRDESPCDCRGSLHARGERGELMSCTLVEE